MFVAMINQPGYMPDSECEQFPLKEDCREYLRSQMESAMNDAIEGTANVEAVEREYNDASEHLSRHGYAYFLGYYYGIN